MNGQTEQELKRQTDIKTDTQTEKRHLQTLLLLYLLLLFIEEYHAACDPCGTIWPRRLSYKERQRGRRKRDEQK